MRDESVSDEDDVGADEPLSEEDENQQYLDAN